MKSRGTSFVFKKLSVQEDKVQLMKGLICNRPAPGLIRIKERSSEVCEFQRPRHFFVGFQLHVACTSWDLFSQLGNLSLHPSASGRVVWNDIKATTLKFKCGKWHLLVSQGGFGRKHYYYTQSILKAQYTLYTLNITLYVPRG